MNPRDERRFSLLLGIFSVLSPIFTFAAGVAVNGSASSRVLAALLILCVTSWIALLVLFLGRHSAEKAAEGVVLAGVGEPRADASTRARLPAIAVTIGVILAAGAGGLLIGREASSLFDSERPVGSPTYARSLRQVLGDLREARAAAYVALDRQSGPIAKGRAAARLGEAFLVAASTLEAVGPRRAGEARLRRRVVARIKALGDAYLDLHAALVDAGGSQLDLNRARLRVVSASRRLELAVRDLGEHGYRVVSLDGAESKQTSMYPLVGSV